MKMCHFNYRPTYLSNMSPHLSKSGKMLKLLSICLSLSDAFTGPQLGPILLLLFLVMRWMDVTAPYTTMFTNHLETEVYLSYLNGLIGSARWVVMARILRKGHFRFS